MEIKKNILTVAAALIIIITVTVFLNKRQRHMSLGVKNGKIETSFKARPDNSINTPALSKSLSKFPERWNVAFDFLSKMNVSELTLGRIVLSEDVFATYSEYTTKNIEDALYESHIDYIDVQYIVSGEEYIGLIREPNNLKVMTPYDANNDITFYKGSNGKLLHATPDSFFIFFPEDSHQPCVKIGDRRNVRKIVVKIKAN